MPPQIFIVGYAKFLASRVHDGVERPVDYSLRADVHPPACSHLPIVRNAHLLSNVPVVTVVKHAYHEGVRDHDPRAFGPGPEESYRVPRFHDESLVVRQHLKILLEQPVLHPVLTNLSCLTIGHKLIGVQCDIEVQVIVDHHLKGFPFDAVAFVLIDGLAPDMALRPETIAVDPSPGAQFLQEFRSHHLMQLLWYIAKCVLQRHNSLTLRKGKSPVRSSSDAGHKLRPPGQFTVQLYCH